MSRSIPAQVTPPHAEKVFARTRLHRWLNGRDSKLIWVEGPPGSGKTTLAANYLRTSGKTVLWYHLDAGDEDPATFFQYLALAAQRVAPRRRQRLPRLSPEQFPGVEAFARSYFEALERELPADTAFVFDNIHELKPESVLHSLLATGLAQLAPRRVVMLMSREGLPPGYSRVSVNRRMVRIDWQMLRLTDEETAGVARLINGRRQTLKVKQLQEATQGWIAGLIIMLEDGGNQKDPPQVAAFSNTLFGYFAREVFARDSASMRRFLMMTALFPDFSVAMAERLTGDRSCRAILKDLLRQHRFIEARSEGELNYRYHPLFREFLQEQARSAWSAEEHLANVRKAAVVLEEAGRTEQAWALYRDSGDAASVIRLLL
jgi:ATP/maltotriose-dependent transcriptional regulator MalT